MAVSAFMTALEC